MLQPTLCTLLWCTSTIDSTHWSFTLQTSWNMLFFSHTFLFFFFFSTNIFKITLKNNLKKDKLWGLIVKRCHISSQPPKTIQISLWMHDYGNIQFNINIYFLKIKIWNPFFQIQPIAWHIMDRCNLAFKIFSLSILKVFFTRFEMLTS
jgi:hypothetical protein